MIGIIHKRATIAVTNTDKSKKKKSGQKKDRTIDLTKPIKQLPSNSAASSKYILKKKVNFSDTCLDQTSVQDQDYPPYLNLTKESSLLPPR